MSRRKIIYLGIDVGTSNIKAALSRGEKILLYSESYPAGTTTAFEHSPAALEKTIITLIKRIVEENRLSKTDLSGISVSGHGPSVVFVDSTGNALTNIITWQDKRAEKEARYLKERFKEFKRDGTSYEAKLLWFFRNKHELFKNGNKVLYPKDYVLSKFTGAMVIDRSAASTTLFYDFKKNDWENSFNGLPFNVLPEIVDSWKQVGVTSGDFSMQCGLDGGIPVFAGGIDAYCEALGAGAVNNGDLVDGSGTSTCISMCSDRTINNDIHVIPEHSLKIRMMSATGLSISWILKLFSEPVEYIERLTVDTPVKLIFLPYLNGERSPYWDEKARGTFIGLTGETGRDEMAAAVLQGIAFGIKQNMLDIGGKRDSGPVRAVGGGAENDYWLKLKADITGKVYNRMKIIHAAALGALILAAFGNKEAALEGLIKRWVKIDKTFYPEKNSTYDKLFTIYLKSYSSLKNIFGELYEA